jgi:hypothetical protein
MQEFKPEKITLHARASKLFENFVESMLNLNDEEVELNDNGDGESVAETVTMSVASMGMEI